MAQQIQQFEDRVRFNWGFHDGSRDAVDRRDVGQVGNADDVYVAGYEAGYEAGFVLGARPESSEPAWQAYQAELALNDFNYVGSRHHY